MLASIRPRFVVWAKDFLEYDSVQMIRIKDVKLGLLNFTIQLIIVTYIIVSMVQSKGYQSSSAGFGTATLKVKGAAYTNNTQFDQVHSTLNVYDAVDIVYPAAEPNSAFITTNSWMTLNQSRGLCTNSYQDVCSILEPCKKNKIVPEGILTGHCLDGYCQVAGWCPLEQEPDPIQNMNLQGIPDFTVFIRSNIAFPEYDIRLHNMIGSKLTEGLNLWTIDQLVRNTGYTYDDVSIAGAMIYIQMSWECNFDYAASECGPKISYYRLDDKSSLSTGNNYRHMYNYNTGKSRDLIKRYGIRLIVVVTGIGSSFDIVTMLTVFGASIGLLSMSSLICDFVSTQLCGSERSHYYRECKFKTLDFDDDKKDSLADNDKHEAINLDAINT